ncbi:efflux RND transporter periplasmic adaptor subunit [Benzoatithermus flavus]|uniref:Efflux RND transporter periplasmic adaptor subunit n=1 Tax=Benzoatithermus flavus TaxID=3108223 RepID=A0ABU8XWK2_9PROT
MLRSLVAILIVLLLGAAAAGAYWKLVMMPAQQQAAAAGPGGGRGGAGGPVPVEATPVRIGTAETGIEAVGTLRSNESVVVRPEVAGRITAINFVEGGMVRKDAVLLELDSSIERAELEQAEAQRDLARANFERAKELRRNNVGTQRSLDEAEASLRTAQAAVDLARARLEKRTLRAPFDAQAGLRNVSPGEFVNAGTEIVNLEQVDPLKVDFRVPEIFLPAVAPGQKIVLAIDAYPGESFTGTVTAIDPLIDKAGRSILIRAEIRNDAGKLRPGLFARVSLTLAERENALFVPEQAIQPQGERQFLFKVVDQGEGKPKVAKLTEVKLGNRRKGEVEVREGLAPGDIVVTAGLLKIRDGVPVQVLPTAGEGQPLPQPRTAPTASRGAAAAAAAKAG